LGKIRRRKGSVWSVRLGLVVNLNRPGGNITPIVNVQDHGYCFVAPVTRGAAEHKATA
jgi:hypothetical protein